MGAQVQRLMGIFGLARELGVGYVHSPIRRIELNPGDPFSSPLERQDFLARVNSFFKLPSDSRPHLTVPRSFSGMTTKQSRKWLMVHKVACTAHTSFIAYFNSSLPWSNRCPEAYEHAAEIIRTRVPARQDTGSLRVDVHIRRALAPRWSPNGSPYERHVPTHWYLTVLDSISRVLGRLDTDPVFRIHTDMPGRPWKIPEDTSPGTMELWRSQDLVDANGYLQQPSEDLGRVFRRLGKIEVAAGWDPLDAIQSMVTADVLVTCASSLSFVAGLLRGPKVTIATPFWHTLPTSWIAISEGCMPSELSTLTDAITLKFGPK